MMTKQRNLGSGFRRCNMLRHVCQFDEETFEQIKAMARKKGTSIAEQIRLLVEWGLEAETKDFSK